MEFVDSQRRYQLLRKLGEGGMGVVYEVRDRARDMRMALKTLRHVDQENIARLKREFRALSELSHPNIINLYELVADRDGWFMTMEVVEGQDLLSHVRHERARARPDGHTDERDSLSRVDDTTSITRVSDVLHQGDSAPSLSASIGLPTPPEQLVPLAELVDMTRLIDTAGQLAEALQALHDPHMVHRDLKPSNVAVTGDNRVVLMDFGIVAELSRTDPGAEAITVGTPHYMAPEQAVGHMPQPSADWYALGVILYEALTGRLPFTGGSMQVLQLKQTRVPLDPTLFAADIPEPLAQLCMQLLIIDEAARPSGIEVLEALGVRRRRRRRHTTMPTSPVPLFVGRVQELHALNEDINAILAGECRAVVVSGSSGMGKTCLVSHFLRSRQNRQQKRNKLLLTGHCRERESVVYKAFDGVMGQLAHYLQHLPEHDLLTILPGDIDFAGHLFPALKTVLPTSRLAAQLVNPTRRRERGIVAFRQLIRNVARHTPVVLRIEDIQWADADSLELLIELVRDPAPHSLLLVMTLRMDHAEAGDRGPTQESTQFIEKLSSTVTYRRLHLAPFDLNEQRELVADAAQFSEFHSDPGHVDDLLWNQPIGHPMLILELMRSAKESGAGDAAPSLEEMLRMRVANLGDPAASTLMNYIALAAHPLPLHVFADACHLSRSECERALSVLRVNLLVRNQRSIPHPWPIVYHAKIRDAMLAPLSETERRVMHTELARAVADWPEAPATTLAEHWLAAGEYQRAAWSRFCAARDAVELLALTRGIELYCSVLELLPRPPDTREQAQLACQTCIGLVETARIMAIEADHAEWLSYGHKVASQYDFIPELTSIHHLWGSLLFMQGDLVGCREHHQLACSFAERARSPYLQARALSGLGDAHYMSGAMISAYDSYRACIELASDFDFDDLIAANLYMRGMTQFYQNDLNTALRDSMEAATIAARVGHKRAEIISRNGCVAWILYEMASFERAQRELDIALSISEELGTERFRPNSMSFTAKVLLQQGQRQQAAAHARASVAMCQANGMALLGPMALSALALATEDADERRAAIEHGWQVLAAGTPSHNHLWFHRDAIDAFLESGDLAQVHRHADALDEFTRAQPLPWSTFHAARARALADHQQGRGDPRQLRALHERAHEARLYLAAKALHQALQSHPQEEP